MFPFKVFPGDLVEIEKASFIICCTKQAISHKWIGRALDCPFLFGLVLEEEEKNFIKVSHNDEWVMTDKEQKTMYKVYILGKIIKLEERCFGGKI